MAQLGIALLLLAYTAFVFGVVWIVLAGDRVQDITGEGDER